MEEIKKYIYIQKEGVQTKLKFGDKLTVDDSLHFLSVIISYMVTCYSQQGDKKEMIKAIRKIVNGLKEY